MRSYCDVGDVYCDSGKNQSVHGTYWRTYRADAVDFIVARFNDSKAATGPTPTTTTGTGPGPSSSPTAKPNAAAKGAAFSSTLVAAISLVVMFATYV